MRVEIVRAAVRDRLQLAPSPGEEILDVDARLGVVRALGLGQLVEAQALRGDAVARVPVLPAVDPGAKDLHIRSVVGHEILELGLLELAHAKREVARRNLVAKRLSDLRDAEGRALARALIDVFEVDEDALSRLRAQIGDGRRILHRAHRRAHHQIEVARLGKRVFAAAVGALRAILEVIGAKAVLADLAIDHDVVKSIDVSRGLPDHRMHDDRRVEGHDVVAQLDGVAPPGAFDVLLEHGSQRSIIPEAVDAAVDLAGLKDEAAPFRKRGNLFHRHAARRCGGLHWGARFCARPANPRRNAVRAIRRRLPRTSDRPRWQRSRASGRARAAARVPNRGESASGASRSRR